MTPMCAPPTVRRVLVPDAFRPARDRIVEEVPWRFGGRLGDYLTPACFEAPDSLVVLRNGRRVAREDWDRQPIYPDDEVGVVLWPGEPATLAIIGFVITVISAIVATWSAVDGARRAKIQGHHMARRQAAMALAMSDSAVYSFDGIQNTTQPGRSILVVYGRHRVGGQVIYAEPYKDKLGKNALDVTIVLSQGEIEEVETATIEINARPLSEFGNVSVETRVGTNTQAAALNHSPGMVIKTLSNPGTEIVASGAAVTFTTQANRTNYEIDLNFPQGLAGLVTLQGGVQAGWVYVQAGFSIRHRTSPAGAWSTPVTVKSGWKWNVFGQFSLTYRSGPLAKNTYDIEITRLANEFKAAPGYTQYIGTAAVNPNGHRSYLSSVREYDNTGLRYPNLALLYVSALASDQLNGMLPTITVIVKGRKLDIYTSAPGDAIVGPLVNGEITSATNFRVTDGHAGFTTVGVAIGDFIVITAGGTAGASVIGTFTVAAVVDQNNLTISGTFAATGTGISFSILTALGVKTNAFSRNPAWCILDLLTHDLYGAGAHLEIGPSDGTEDTGDLDIRSFIDAAAFCDALVARRPTAGNPIAEGTATATTNAGGNQISFTSGTTLPVSVQVGDRLSIEGGADFADYRIETINAARNIVTVATVTGGTVTLTGSTLNDWHVDATEQRAFCDYVIDGQTNVLDAASAMAKAARMELVQGLGPYSLLPDQAGLPVAVFGSGNAIDGTYRHEYLAHRMLANKVEVQFLNADLNYQQDIVQLEDPAVLVNSEEVVVEPIEAYSATRLTQVQRIAQFNYLSNRYERELIEFETSIEGLPVRVFDVIAYVHEIMRPGEFFSGRAAAGTTDVTLMLGQALDVPAGTVDIYVQTHTDEAVAQDLVLRGTILQAAGARIDTVTVTDWLDVEAGDVTVSDGPRPGDPWMLVPRATPEEAQRWWKVLSVSLGQEGRRKIRAVAYRDEIYDEEPVPATLVAGT